jgi:hypothetical protein
MTAHERRQQSSPRLEENPPMTTHGFAIYPDGEDHPTALFADLEEATEWALEKYGSDRFAIKYLTLMPAEATGAAAAN